MIEIINTDKAPKAVGPYSQAVKTTFREMLFCSGQLPINPETGSIISSDAAVQAKQVMKNLEAVLNSCGFEMSDIVKTTIYLTDFVFFDEINSVYASCFQNSFPARSTVQVSALPKGALVEIDAIALK